MKNLKNWLNKNNFNFEVQNNMKGEEIVFINVQGVGAEQVKKIKAYLKRYKFNFEYRCNYTFILAKKEELKEETTKENYINLTKEEHQELITLSNIWGKKVPTDKEQGKHEFLHLLFKYQEQKKTKEELKKYINKLYAANKSIKEANKNKKGYNNYLVDILAAEDILQSNDIIKNEFFKNAYNYIKSS